MAPLRVADMPTVAEVVAHTDRTLGPCPGFSFVDGRPKTGSGCGHLPSEHVVDNLPPISFHACRRCDCRMYVPGHGA